MEPMRGRTWRWRRVTEFGIYTMRDHEADVPLIDLSPESDQRPGHICHICHPHTQTQTEEEREKQTWGEEDGKDVDMPGLSKDVNRTEHKR